MSDAPHPRAQTTDPCARVERVGADGASLTICAHGGHVTGWRTPDGVERLWTSPLARCGPGEAIRGGIPVIFPQFAARGSGPRHGFARDRAWRLDPGDDAGDRSAARAVAVLEPDDELRALWPHRFTLTLVAEASGPSLTVALRVDAGDDLAFSAALHAYLATSDAAGVRVEGLSGLPAEQNADRSPTSLGPAVSALGPVDVAVHGVTGPVTLDDPALGRLDLRADGFADRVLWNPGSAHGLDDVPQDGASRFVCVEPAALDAVTLRGGESWTGRLELLLR